ncbi:MAG: hypothetical protein IID42_07755, partial [Planctomycetes bacterium]|nr:hypothetical protein [Planctomycetota bacterium]
MNTNLMVERAALLQRYRKLRSTMRELHSELLGSLSKETLARCGKKLGFMVDGTLVFESEDESSVLMDYCLYQGWSGQHNAISRFLAKRPYGPGSDEMVLLEAMSNARYSLMQVESMTKGVGVNCRDLLRSDGGSIVDEGLGNTASEGVVFGCHLVVLPEMSITTGAPLPIDADALGNILHVLEGGAEGIGQVDFDNLNHQEQAALSSIIIRCALAGGASSRITMVGPRRRPGLKRRERSTAQRPSRNDPCSCG